MKVILALATMLAINIFLFLGQVGVDYVATNELGDTGASTLYNYEGSYLQEYDDSDGNYVIAGNASLPDVEGSVNPDTGNFFIDPIGSLKSFFTGASKGVKYFGQIINGVPNFLKTIGLPNEIAFALGFFWHVLTVFLIIMLVWGRQV